MTLKIHNSGSQMSFSRYILLFPVIMLCTRYFDIYVQGHSVDSAEELSQPPVTGPV